MDILNLKLINDYISSKRISKKNINTLENNTDCMMAVIVNTNDPKMYRFCSDEVKLDYRFVKFFVEKFKDNVPLINEVARYFIDNSKDEINKLELNIIMSDLTSDYLDYHLQYQLSSFASYNIIDIYHSTIASAIDSSYLKKAFGLGFCNVEDNYSSSEIIMDYIAKRMVNDICVRNIKKLETDLHNNFKNPDEVKEFGLNNIMIDFISTYDNNLAIYLQTRTDLLESLRCGLLDIVVNWQIYNIKLDDLKINHIIDIYSDYVGKIDIKPMFTEYDLLQYIFRIFGIANILTEYLDSEDYVFVGKYFDEFDDYIYKEICKSEKNIHLYNNLFEAIDCVLNEKDPNIVKEVKPSECVVTRLRA